MAKESETARVREFLVVALPELAEPGSTLRLLGAAKSQAAAEKLVSGLGSGTTGRVAVLERRALFLRRPAIETVDVSGRITKG